MPKRKAEESSNSVPAGFERIQTGSFAPIHDFKKAPKLVGIVQEKRTSEQKRGGKLVPVQILAIANEETGEITSVWESHALLPLMQRAEKGDRVFIEFLGVKKLKGKKTLKDFACGLQPAKKRK